MKHLFFALLACLLTACFRAPHLPTLLPQQTAFRPTQVAPPLSPDTQVYASASEAAAAGTAPAGTGEAPVASAATPSPTPASARRVAAAPEASPARQPGNLQRKLRKVVRTALLSKRPASGKQDNPAPGKSALPTVALIAGVIGVVGLVGSFAGGIIGLGTGSALLFGLGFLGGLTAIIAGGIAKGRIRRGKDAESGRGKATAGLILGIVNLSIVFLLFILALIIAFALSGWVE